MHVMDTCQAYEKTTSTSVFCPPLDRHTLCVRAEMAVHPVAASLGAAWCTDQCPLTVRSNSELSQTCFTGMLKMTRDTWLCDTS